MTELATVTVGFVPTRTKQPVGWVEPFETHHIHLLPLMGFAIAPRPEAGLGGSTHPTG